MGIDCNILSRTLIQKNLLVAYNNLSSAKDFPLANVANRSSRVGKGYWSTVNTGLIIPTYHDSTISL